MIQLLGFNHMASTILSKLEKLCTKGIKYLSPDTTGGTAKPLKPMRPGTIPPGDGRRLEQESSGAARAAVRLQLPLLELHEELGDIQRVDDAPRGGARHRPRLVAGVESGIWLA